MKHVEAGLVVGAAVLIGLTAAAVLWAVVKLFAGPIVASIIIAIVIIVTVGATVLDWATERKEQ